MSSVSVQDFLSFGLPAGEFGSEVAVDGETLAINHPGSPIPVEIYDRNDAGTPLNESDDTWEQQAFLFSSNLDTNDDFGASIAIDGRTMVIGAPNEESNATGVNGDESDNSLLQAGAAYVFVDPNGDGDWSDAEQQAYLKPSNTDEFDAFGTSVDISGDTIVIGAPGEASNATGVNGDESDNSLAQAGAAYVFVDPNGDGDWTDAQQDAYLKASNTDATDNFGGSVAISGNTIIVGALGEDSSAMGVNGDQADDTVGEAGAAYVFVDPNSDGDWSDAEQQAYLKASNTGPADVFGSTVALNGSTIVVGAPNEDSSAMGVNGDEGNNLATNSGAAYVFVDPNGDGEWSDAVQQAYLKAFNTDTGDEFGRSVAIDGSTIVVGANEEESRASGVNGDESDNFFFPSGAAYVFVDPNGDGSWQDAVREAYLKSAINTTGDAFGVSVAVSGNTVVGGAPGAGDEGNGSATAFFVPIPIPRLVTGADAGGGSHVRVFDPRTQEEKFGLFAYPGFTGGVRVATGDVNGDGTPDIITAPGPGGGPHIKVFDGNTGTQLSGAIGSFMAYDGGFTGGVYVTAADVNVDGFADVITGPGAGGGPHVRVFSGADGSELFTFFAYDAAFTGGVRVGAGDVNNDGTPDVITGAGPGGGPHVRAFSGDGMSELASFFAFEPDSTGGAFVAGGNVSGDPDSPAEILTGEGTNGNRARVFTSGGFLLADAAQFGTGDVRVAAVDVNRDGQADLLTSRGATDQGTEAEVRAFDVDSGTQIAMLTPYPGFAGGSFVAGSAIASTGGSPLLAAGGETVPEADAAALSEEQLAPIANAAFERLEAVDLSAEQRDVLTNIELTIIDLPRAQLGFAAGNHILIDINAAGYGWFVDATPNRDEEFRDSNDGRLEATDPVVGDRMDLLTVVMHEYGHHLGLDDLDPLSHPDNLMSNTLDAPRRRLPATAVDNLFGNQNLLDATMRI